MNEIDLARRRIEELLDDGLDAISVVILLSSACSVRIFFRRAARSKSLWVRGVSNGFEVEIDKERERPFRGLMELPGVFESSMVLDADSFGCRCCGRCAS